MTKKIINSVGIDVGTTTSQAIFSRLELINSAAASEVPRYDFSDRSISYISPVIFTPKDSEDSIDGLELLNFIDEQYQKAGLSINDVESGAIIITGEASKAKNAKDTVMELSSQLGDFVVATAGPHLESVIAGHGSGASEHSRINGSKVLNIDIGGGTSNFSVFLAGQLLDTSCLNVGGRLIELNQLGNITKIHKPAQVIVDELFKNSNPTDLNQEQLNTVISCMTDLICMVSKGEQSDLLNELLMTDNLKPHGQFDAVFISGGVGECFYNLSNVDDFVFGDIGPLLANNLKQNSYFKNLNVLKPDNTLRATVIGAGMHTLSLSGSTIWLSYEDLPICNIPVLHIGTYTGNEPDEIAQSWQSVGRMHDLDLDQDSYAIAVPSYLPVSYKSVQTCAQAITKFTKLRKNNSYPLIVLASQDFGKALGMELQYSIDTKDLAVIDEVQVREWDYIDIGKGMFNNSVVPLTVKSLAFPS